MPGYQGYGYYPDPEEERRLREMDLTQDPEAHAGTAGVRPPPPTMDLTQDPVALQGSPDWQRMNQSRVDMRDELDNPPPSMDLTRDPAALNSPMLRQQMAQRAPQPPAAGLPMQGSLSSLLPQRDSQMDSRWRTAENNALDSSGYMGDQKYGVGEAVRDFAPMAIGGGLDILLNKGRGLGALAGAGMQANAQQQKNRDAEAQSAGEFALSARNQRAQMGNPQLDAAYKTAQMERWQSEANRGDLNVAAREREIKIREAKAAYDRDPSDPQAQRMAALVQQETGVDVTGLGNQAQGRLMPIAKGSQALQNTGPAADARNASDLRYAGPTAAATAVGKEQGQLAAAGTTASKNRALGQVPEAEINAQNYATQFAKDNEAPIKVGLALQEILSKSQDGSPAPGLDPASRLGSKIPGVANFLPQDAQNVLQNLDLAEEAYARDQSGAAIGVKEGAKFLRQILGNPLAKAEQVQKAITNFNERNNEYLRARSAGNPDAANKVLGAAGLSIGGSRQGSRQNFGPDADHPSNLGKAPAPRFDARGGTANQVPTAKQSADGSFDIDGETYTADEVRRLKAKGLIR